MPTKKSRATDLARKREYRAAQRYLKKANEGYGVTAEKNRALARMHLQNALETYDNSAPAQKISSTIINLGAALGVDVQGYRAEQRRAYENMGEEDRQKQETQRRKVVREANKALAKQDEKKLSENEARALIANPVIGKRIMGGLVDVWSDAVEKGESAYNNRREAQRAIFKYFHVSSWAEVLEKLEQSIGSELYSIATDLEMYDVVRIAIQQNVIGNTYIQ